MRHTERPWRGHHDECLKKDQHSDGDDQNIITWQSQTKSTNCHQSGEPERNTKDHDAVGQVARARWVIPTAPKNLNVPFGRDVAAAVAALDGVALDYCLPLRSSLTDHYGFLSPALRQPFVRNFDQYVTTVGLYAMRYLHGAAAYGAATFVPAHTLLYILARLADKYHSSAGLFDGVWQELAAEYLVGGRQRDITSWEFFVLKVLNWQVHCSDSQLTLARAWMDRCLAKSPAMAPSMRIFMVRLVEGMAQQIYRDLWRAYGVDDVVLGASTASAALHRS